MHLARCKNGDCKRKEECKRYTEEDCQPINFKALMTGDECKWFYQLKQEIVKDEQEEQTEEVPD